MQKGEGMNGETVRKGSELPIACDLTALDAGQMERKRSLQERLSAEVRELPDGYAFRHSSEPSVLLALAEFVTLERLCCPFFDFRIDVGRDGGPVWLRMRGGEEAKEILRAGLEQGCNAPRRLETGPIDSGATSGFAE
jgi:hypothetical protein